MLENPAFGWCEGVEYVSAAYAVWTLLKKKTALLFLLPHLYIYSKGHLFEISRKKFGMAWLDKYWIHVISHEKISKDTPNQQII